jgi:predicted nucleotidyltransferase
MKEIDRRIVQDIKRRLPEEVQCHVERYIVFGSRARGDASADSDLDLIVLVDKKTVASFESAVARDLSFYKNVDSHGITV